MNELNNLKYIHEFIKHNITTNSKVTKQLHQISSWKLPFDCLILLERLERNGHSHSLTIDEVQTNRQCSIVS